jgi:hypothetical protein
MRPSFRSSAISRIALAACAIWIYGAGAAWAGGGGESLTSLNNLITGLCAFLNISSCPQFPTITQAVLELAGLEITPPEMVRALNNVPPGSNVDAGNAAAIPPITFPLTTATSPTLSDLLSTLTPLAFIDSADKHLDKSGAEKNNGTAAAAQLYDPDADTFLYAVASGTSVALSGLTIPDTFYLFYDDLSRSNANFSQGRIAAKFSLPLTVLNSDGMTERPVAATLQYIAPSRGGLPCSASTVSGNFSGSGTQTLMAGQVGVNCAVVFSASPTSPRAHAIFEVQIPLLVTAATDPGHFWFAQFSTNGPFNPSVPSAFFSDDLGFAPAPGVLGANGKYIGIAPSAAPLCTSVSCPVVTPPPPPPGIFALCADLPRNGNGQALVPSVAAYYAISTAGETLLSAALPATSTSVCPAL